MSHGIPVAKNLAPAWSALGRALPTDLASYEDVVNYRAIGATRAPRAETVTAAYPMTVTETTIAGSPVSIFRPDGDIAARVVFVHGGGMVAGARFDGVDVVVRHAQAHGVEVWTLDYPLAPEHTLAEMVEATVAVVHAAASEGTRVLLSGQSGGGAVALATALAARDRGFALDGLLLVCPMFRAATDAAQRHFAGDPSWSTQSNATAWNAALAGAAGEPAERADLEGLPPTYLDAGSAELFRGAILDFATRLGDAGVPLELHVWSGGFHAFDCVDETAPVSRQSHRVRGEWIERWVAGQL